MATPRLPQNEYQEKLLASFVNASSAATFVRRFFKATRPTRVRRALYNNPTGLALDASNGFALSVKRVGPSDALSFTAFTFTTTHGSETGQQPRTAADRGWPGAAHQLGRRAAGRVRDRDRLLRHQDRRRRAPARGHPRAGVHRHPGRDQRQRHRHAHPDRLRRDCARPVTVADGIDTTDARRRPRGDKPVALTLSATAPA
jgi:hypothetical protein